MERHLLTIGLIVFLVIGCNMSAANPDNRDTAGTTTQPDNSINANKTIGNAADEGEAKATPTPVPPKPNGVCPDPAKPCQHKDKTFDDWELSFKMPAKIAPNKAYKSAPFYAVLLKTYKIEEDCDGGEYVIAVDDERKQLQKEQPGRKVFADFECPNMGAVAYDFDGKWDAKKEFALIDSFLAVYAGETKEEADALLQKLKVKYPKAVIKQMTESYELIYQ